MKKAKQWLVLVITGSFLMWCGSSCKYDYIEPVTPAEVSFSKHIIPIFDRSCNMAPCHSTGDIPPDLTLGNAYDDLFINNMIDTLNPEQSILYVSMNSITDPMPPTGRLSSSEIALVLAWIKQGAENN